jgi:phenylacetate-CoA ligase
VWIGGLITFKAFEILSKRGRPISIITPGINMKEILNSLKKLSPEYDQTILVGYPPFVKDVLDEAIDEGIKLNKLNLKFLFAAEAFSEKFRDYIADKAQLKNVCNETLNIYGTADIGAMAFETPTSILIRRLLSKNQTAMNSVFGNISRTPTLAQYNPYFVSFETIDGEIVLTGDSQIPLIRYSIGDHGGTYDFRELEDLLSTNGINLKREAERAGVHLYELPFVYVYERTDFSTTLYGLQIYPEVIREVLLNRSFQKYVTGKFTLETVYDSKHDQHLAIQIELKRNATIPKAIHSTMLHTLVDSLRKNNSEYRELSDFIKKRADPSLIFWPTGDPKYFPVGIKQKWVRKQK